MPAQLRSGLAFALLTLAPAPLAAQADLPVGRTAEASASDTQPARFRFAAAAAGVLSVAVQGGGDVTLAVTDEDGQLVQEGSSDQDRGGDTGRETLSVILPHPGEYHVVVRQLDASTHPFRIGAAWLAFPPFELPPDPDGRPGLARSQLAGKARTPMAVPALPASWLRATPTRTRSTRPPATTATGSRSAPPRPARWSS